ncbi:KRAB-A domain-containing protein 2-like isoform X1 [Bombyx mandarina]|uniref:KRAB-A domain-containing protein 2-like isoform X1 n=1 Tax=Bombyx mandarina TaxID=7092 RepID=A0A6J2KIF5_BOMMA|nr:KRAB-A domain-containing protein 2-like isoform X1 [Bombyx mandarina]
MVYQDHLTKFVVLRPLKTKRAEEVAHTLLDIFTLLGAPAILQSDNGREFSNRIIDNLKTYWPTLKIIHGKPRHSQSQGSVERANQDIENMLTTWMQDNDNSHWSEGLRFVQLMKNRAMHAGIKQSPYEALFGCKVKVGLQLPNDFTQNFETENLEKIIQDHTKKEDPKVSACELFKVNTEAEVSQVSNDVLDQHETNTQPPNCTLQCSVTRNYRSSYM